MSSKLIRDTGFQPVLDTPELQNIFEDRKSLIILRSTHGLEARVTMKV
jgi:hypothetical protein